MNPMIAKGPGMMRSQRNGTERKGKGTLSFRTSSGFTLVELLVVIAVIAILAGLLLPVLAMSKAKARLVHCINNERQMSLAWTMYAQDANDKLVANGPEVLTALGVDSKTKFWVQGVVDFVTSDSTNRSFLVDPKYALFADYIKTPTTYKCPEDHSTVRDGLQVQAVARSYSLNCYTGWAAAWTPNLELGGTRGKFFKKFTQIDSPAPALLMTFLDVNPKSICWPFFGVAISPPGSEVVFHYPAVYHNNRAAIAFADAHVEPHRWRDPRILAPRSSAFHSHHDSSFKNNDVLWLEQHATSLR